MSPAEQARAMLARCGVLRKRLQEQRGSVVGIACKSGLFAVTESTRIGRKERTEQLTAWQSYADCLAHMERMIG